MFGISFGHSTSCTFLGAFLILTALPMFASSQHTLSYTDFFFTVVARHWGQSQSDASDGSTLKLKVMISKVNVLLKPCMAASLPEYSCKLTLADLGICIQ